MNLYPNMWTSVEKQMAFLVTGAAWGREITSSGREGTEQENEKIVILLLMSKNAFLKISLRKIFFLVVGMQFVSCSLCYLIIKKGQTCSEIYIIQCWGMISFFNCGFITFSWVAEIIELLLPLFHLVQVILSQVCASGVPLIQMHVTSHYWTELTPGLHSVYDKIRLKWS